MKKYSGVGGEDRGAGLLCTLLSTCGGAALEGSA